MAAEYDVRSNPESGLGRVDVMITPKHAKGPGIIMELKVWQRHREKDLDAAFDAAKRQIEGKGYEASLKAQGLSPIIKYIAVFDGKRVWVRKVLKAVAVTVAEADS